MTAEQELAILEKRINAIRKMRNNYMEMEDASESSVWLLNYILTILDGAHDKTIEIYLEI